MISHNAAQLKKTASNGTCILILVYPIKIVQYQTPSSYDQQQQIFKISIRHFETLYDFKCIIHFFLKSRL